jgi:Fe-S-cluster containining protein
MYVTIDHPRFRHTELEVFTKTITDDCMTHRCLMHETGAQKLDACCQYGCDVDLSERDAILMKRAAILPVLREDARAAAWFDESEPEIDPDTRSGIVVRTAVLDGGCIFLAHDKRGCAIHRAALEQGWDFRVVKPTICQLFPLSYTTDAIVVSEDYEDYSCAHLANAPTLYRVARTALGITFGDELVRAMDAAEARVKATRLPVVT